MQFIRFFQTIAEEIYRHDPNKLPHLSDPTVRANINNTDNANSDADDHDQPKQDHIKQETTPVKTEDMHQMIGPGQVPGTLPMPHPCPG